MRGLTPLTHDPPLMTPLTSLSLLADYGFDRIAVGNWPAAELTLVFGKRVENEGQLDGGLILIHPRGTSGQLDWRQVRHMYLPELDFSPAGQFWESQAQQHQIPITYSPGVSTDILAAWPQVMEASARGD